MECKYTMPASPPAQESGADRLTKKFDARGLMAGASVGGDQLADEGEQASPPRWTWRTVVACKRLNEFEVWAAVRGWNKKGLPRRKRWAILRFIADHAWLAVAGDKDASVRRWLFDWAPGLTEAELVELIDGAESSNWLWRSDACAELLGISAADRETHNIRFLGANDDPDRSKRAAYAAARRRARRESERLRKMTARRAAGAKPRAEYEANSISQTKPWLAAGFKTRRTWERHGKPEAEVVASPSADKLISQEPTYERTHLRHDSDAEKRRASSASAPDSGRATRSTAEVSQIEKGARQRCMGGVGEVLERPVLFGEIIPPGEDATVATSDREEVLRLAQRYTQERLALARFM